MIIFYSFLIGLISLVNKKIPMQTLNNEFDIRLFSHLIQTVLCCRLGKKRNIEKQISAAITKLQSPGQTDWTDLNFGIQMLSKLHEGSNFYVYNMMEKHFLSHNAAKYCIYLEIFTLHNKRQQQQNRGKQDKDRLIEKWVFRKQKDKKVQHHDSINQNTQSHTDLIFKVLTFIMSQNQFESINSNKTQILNNTTPNKGYQLVIKSHCPKKRKNIIHVLHLQKSISQLEVHTQSLKSSLLELPNFWQKSIKFNGQNAFFVGCYFYQPLMQGKTGKVETVDSAIIKQPDRKLSSQTKAEQKESTCSFKFSLENFSFRFSENKKFKQSSDIQSIRKTSEEIANLHRPRYQSIYESKDEEMNIFILSPRKLSEEESPKIKHLQQKPIKFEITDQIGISEELIEQFVLQSDELMSNQSSEGFQMLEENDQLDSINEQKSTKALEKANNQRVRKQKYIISQLITLENELIANLRSVDNGWLLSV